MSIGSEEDDTLNLSPGQSKDDQYAAINTTASMLDEEEGVHSFYNSDNGPAMRHSSKRKSENARNRKNKEGKSIINNTQTSLD